MQKEKSSLPLIIIVILFFFISVSQLLQVAADSTENIAESTEEPVSDAESTAEVSLNENDQDNDSELSSVPIIQDGISGSETEIDSPVQTDSPDQEQDEADTEISDNGNDQDNDSELSSVPTIQDGISGSETEIDSPVQTDPPDQEQDEIEIDEDNSDVQKSEVDVQTDETSGLIAGFHTEINSNTLPIAVDFFNESMGDSIDSYSWDFGDGGESDIENPSHLYTTSGTFVVRLTIAQGDESDTEIQEITIEPDGNITDLTAGFSAEPATGRAPLTVNFIETATGETAYLWQFDGISQTSTEANPTVIYDLPGEYEVTQTVMNGTDTAVAFGLVYVLPPLQPPVAKFDADIETGTAPLTVTLSNTSEGDIDLYQWSCGEAVPTIVTTIDAQCAYTEAGVYPIVLTVEGEGGFSQALKIIRVTEVITEVIADFFYDIPDPLNSLTVILDSTPSAGNITGYEWHISDGTTLEGSIVQHTFDQPGLYDITLDVTGLDNSTSSFTQQISVVILDGPIADFYVNKYTQIAPANISFYDTSLAGSSNIVNWLWEVPSLGFRSNLQNTSFEFIEPGIYEVELIVLDANGYESRQVKEITIVEKTIDARFTYTKDSVFIDQEIQFIDQTDGKTPVKWEWNFNGEGTSTDQHPTFAFTSTGAKVVTLKATAADGTSDTYTVTIEIIGIDDVLARFDRIPSSGISSVAVELIDRSIGNILSYLWKFGDGTEYQGQDPPIHTFEQPGQYTIELIVTDVSGTQDSTSKKVTVYRPASVQIDAMPISGIAPMRVDFEAIVDGSLNNFVWDMGDGFKRYGQRPSHVFTAPGEYLVSLVANGQGGRATNSITIHVYESGNIRAAFRANHYMGIPPEKICFTNLSTGQIDSVLWDFGDGESSNTMHPCHRYKTAGDFRVSLQVIGDGRTGEAISTIRLYDHSQHLINLTFEENGEQSICFFTDVEGNPTLHWLFGDGQSVIDREPCYTYAEVGTYQVSVKVVDESGLITVGYKDIVITDESIYEVTPVPDNDPDTNDTVDKSNPRVDQSVEAVNAASLLEETDISPTFTPTPNAVSAVGIESESTPSPTATFIQTLETPSVSASDNIADDNNSVFAIISTISPDDPVTASDTEPDIENVIMEITPGVVTVRPLGASTVESLSEDDTSTTKAPNDWALVGLVAGAALATMSLMAPASAQAKSTQDCVIAVVTVQSWPHQFSTLSGIAAHYYGDYSLYTLLAKYNNIANPDLIYPGWTIIVPREQCLTGTQPPPVKPPCPAATSATQAYNDARQKEWEADQAYFDKLREIDQMERRIEGLILQQEARKVAAENCQKELILVNISITVLTVMDLFSRIFGRPSPYADELQKLKDRKKELERCRDGFGFINAITLAVLLGLQLAVSAMKGSDLPKIKQERKAAQRKRAKAHETYVKSKGLCDLVPRNAGFPFKANPISPDDTSFDGTYVFYDSLCKNGSGVKLNGCEAVAGPEGRCAGENLHNILDMIVIHHIGSLSNSLQADAEFIRETNVKGYNLYYDQNDAKYADVPYHFMVDQKGVVHGGRPLNVRGTHVKCRNTGTIGILLLGDFDITENLVNTPLTDAMIISTVKLIQWLKVQFPNIGANIYGHRELELSPEFSQKYGGNINQGSTVCPGDLVMTKPRLNDSIYVGQIPINLFKNA